jgi:hypothetical protein
VVAIGVIVLVASLHLAQPMDKSLLYKQHLQAAGVTERSAKFGFPGGNSKDQQSDLNAGTDLGNTVCQDLAHGAGQDAEVRKIQFDRMFSPDDGHAIVYRVVRDLCPAQGAAHS